MERDAQTRVQLIDAYLIERLNEVQTLSQSTPIRNFLAGATDQNSRNRVFEALFTAQHREVANYISWSLFDRQGNVLSSYPTAPQTHGKYLILPDALQQIRQSSKVIVSDVFYDAAGNIASVDLYARVISDTFQVLGYVRASLGLHRIWQPVDNETQTSGAGSYGFILDQNGVRIAYTNPDSSGLTHPDALFTSVAPISHQFQQRITSENLYGNTRRPVKVMADQSLANIQQAQQTLTTFQFTPSNQNQVFEAAMYRSTIVPWSYYILKPLSAVTGIADQQLFSTILIATLVLVLAVIIGLVIGRRIALPILRSVSFLRRNSHVLKELSNEERVVVKEQVWMIEASKVGLQSVQYYTKACSVATQRIRAISTNLAQDTHRIDPQMLSQGLKEILEVAVYIEQATRHQDETNKKLETALRVTTQVTDQLTKGAQAADNAATELENIVEQLTSVVGG